VINFSNKVIIPFGATRYLSYDAENKVFLGGMGEPVFKPDGTKIAGTEKRSAFTITNGYVICGEDGDDTGNFVISPKTIISVKTGKTYSIANIKASECSLISAGDTLWAKKDNKWGLIDVNGKTILPFEYDEINLNAWLIKAKPYALVNKGGKGVWWTLKARCFWSAAINPFNGAIMIISIFRTIPPENTGCTTIIPLKLRHRVL
jgi:hypothetical protein